MNKARSRRETVGVAELKRRFAEYLDRVSHDGERVVVRRRGRQVAALVPLEDLENASAPPPSGLGLVAAAGAWEEHPDVDELIDTVYRARRRARDRKVEPVD